LSDVLLYGSGRNDCILLRAAHGGFNGFFDAGQRGRKIADGAFGCGFDRPITRLGRSLFHRSLDLGQRDGQVLERQLSLILG